MERNQKKAEAILRKLEKLACGRVNDAVRLAYLGEEEISREEIAKLEQLDLAALTEFKRNSNGTVEIKLADRAALLERIYHLLKEEDNGATFLQALEENSEC